MKEEEITQEFLEELHELGRWDGCETGDLVFNLIDLYESSGRYYASDNFQKSLEGELIELYTMLKDNKDYEDAENELKTELFTKGTTRVKIIIDDLEFSFSTISKFDNKDDKQLAEILKETVRMLEAETLEDKEIF
jgi:hypothetical protein